MGQIADGFTNAFRDFVVATNPASGVANPAKADIRAIGISIDAVLASAITALLIGNAVTYPTLAGLNADLAHSAGVLGLVYADSTAANNGIYVKVGASGTGSWSLTNIVLPSSISGTVSNLTTQLAAETAARAAADLAETVRAQGAEADAVSTFVAPRLLTPIYSEVALDSKGRVVRGLRKDGFAADPSGPTLPIFCAHPDIEFAVVDQNWRAVQIRYRDGTQWPPAGGAGTGTYYGLRDLSVDGRAQVFLISNGALTKLSIDAAGDDAAFGIDGQRAQWVNTQGSTQTPRAVFVNRRSTLAAGITKLVLVPCYGQSLAMGALGTPAVTTVPPLPGRLLTWAGGPRPLQVRQFNLNNAVALDPRRIQDVHDGAEVTSADGQDGETIATRAGLSLATTLPTTTAVFAWTAAMGGNQIANLAKGTVPYANLMAEVQEVVAWGRMLGLTVEVAGIPWKQGEDNANTAYATYYPLLVALQAAIEADVKAMTGQTASVPFVSSQLTANPTNDGIVNPPVQALFDASVALPAKFVLVSPDFRLPHIAPGTHLYGTGYAVLGENLGQALATVYGGGSWGGIPNIASAVRSGTSVTVTFDRAITLDTTTVSDPGNRGWGIVDTGGATITAVGAPSGATVALTLSRAPAAGYQITLGRQPRDGTGSGPTAGPRHNYRDAGAAVSAVDGTPLWKWAALQSVTPSS